MYGRIISGILVGFKMDNNQLMNKYGIIGYPLKHSISPQIHNSAFNALKINALYQKIEINPTEFEETIKQLKHEDWRGFNITIPFKETIIKYLDDIDPMSANIGAINTIKISNGKWRGYNTDYLGFVKPIEKYLDSINSVLVLGAGGAARAVIYGILEKLKIEKIYLANRTKSRAELLVQSVKYSGRTKIEIIDFSTINHLNDPINLIVNTTSLGMGNEIDKTPLEISEKYSNCIVYDLIYNPKKSKLLTRAEEQACQIINGLPMLIYQADESFKIWTGINFPDKVIEKFLLSS